MSTELRDDDREAILGSLDKDVEEEEENEGEERDGDEMGLVESAEMEGKVVEEAIGGGLKTGGARSGGGHFALSGRSVRVIVGCLLSSTNYL